MPIFTYKCPDGHATEQFFKTFSQAEQFSDFPILCDTCRKTAKKADWELPLPAHFYGNPDGYHKPSPTGRHSTKLVSSKEGNRNSAG